MRSRFLAALLLFALQTPAHAIDDTPLSDMEKHYVRSMSRMMMILFMCPTGNYLIPPQMIQALADRSDVMCHKHTFHIKLDSAAGGFNLRGELAEWNSADRSDC